MFGATVRLAAGFAAAMLVMSLLKKVLAGTLLPMIKADLGKSHMIYQSLDGVLTWLPVIILLTACAAFLYRGVIEHNAPGA